MSAPLPINIYTNDPLRSAYDICLWLEFQNIWGIQYYCSYGLLHAPSDKGRLRLAHEISGCNRDLDVLAGLVHLYVLGLIRVFRNPTGPTPAISTSQSPGNIPQQQRQNLVSFLTELKANPSMLKAILLNRDNYSCVFTGDVNAESWKDKLIQKPPNARSGQIDTAHIISQPLVSNIQEGMPDVPPTRKCEWATTATAMIGTFGDFDCESLLGEQLLNNPVNMFLATPQAHYYFDRLEVYLTPALDQEGDAQANAYDLRTFPDPKAPDFFRPQVSFSPLQLPMEDGKIYTISPPDSHILAVHAACANIAHFSGVSDIFDELYRRDIDYVPLTVSSQDMVVNEAGFEELTRALYQAQWSGYELMT
ncbi:hypothetical protein ABKN59_010935 [Abortiporus biennis]